MTRPASVRRFWQFSVSAAAAGALMALVSAGSYAQDPGNPAPSRATQEERSDTTRLQPGTALPPDPGYALIKVLARPSKDSVVLRWAPTTPHGWRIGNRLGYSIERKDASGQTVLLTPQPILPWDVEPWTELLSADSANAFVGIAVYSLYGDTLLAGLADSLGQDTVGANAEQNANLFGYALFAADNDPVVAAALGLRFVDRSVTPGARYTYTVTLAGPQTYRIDPGTVEAVTRAAEIGPPPPRLAAIGRDASIQLRWDPNTGNEYSAYNIYRSEDRGRSYRKMNTAPIAIVVPSNRDVPPLGAFVDTTIINYRKYRYRVRGIDAFGDLGKAAEVEASGRDLTPPPQPLVTNAEQVGRSKLRIRWAMTDLPPDLAGFAISRSAFPDSNYARLTKRLLAAAAREYVDEKARDQEPYYIVTALDTAGNAAPSFPLYGMLIDTIPPAIPKGLRGTVDSLGCVTLRWNRNRESNILGYRVLRANALEHEFTQLSGAVCRDTMFVDSIAVQTLTRTVHYRIAAVNTRYAHSEMSPPITLRRQERYLPTAPVFTDVTATDSTATVQWAVNSQDKIRSILLFRRLAGIVRWDTLAVLPHSAESYTDSRLTQNTLYEYQVAVVDTGGEMVMAELPVQARPYNSGVRSPVRELTIAYSQEPKGILLTWAYDSPDADRFYFVIYRSMGEKELIQLRSVPGTARQFIDRGLIGDGTYRYCVQVVTHGGAESPLSEPVSLLVETTQ